MCAQAIVQCAIDNMLNHAQGLYSPVVERRSCKLMVLGSIPSGGSFFLQCDNLGAKLGEGVEQVNVGIDLHVEFRSTLREDSTTRCKCSDFINASAQLSLHQLATMKNA